MQESKIKKFYLFSSNYKLAQKIMTLGSLESIYFEKRHFNQDIYNFLILKNIPFFMIEKIEELETILPSFSKDSVGISFGEGLFFKNYHIQKFDHGIWNIHTGKLPDNRGRHPIAWSFFNNDEKFYITIHKINEELDQGELLYDDYIHRDINDTQKDVLEKLIAKLENNFLDCAIENYFLGKSVKLHKGIYNQQFRITEQVIIAQDYTMQELYNLFKSQTVFGKINVNGKLYSTCDIFHSDLTYSLNGDIITVKNGQVFLGK